MEGKLMKTNTSAAIIDLKTIRTNCRECASREMCLSSALDDKGLAALEKVTNHSRTIMKGEFLYNMGDPLRSLYVIRMGSIKTSLVTADGQIHVMGFFIPGDLLGIDAISNNVHPCDAVALETCLLCELPMAPLQELAHEFPAFQYHLLRRMSHEIVRDEELMFMLGHLPADARLAVCLLNFRQRYGCLGYPQDEFRLSMTRQDLADYLGLSIETVSRLFTRFQQEGLIQAQARDVRLLDLARLRAIGESSPSVSTMRA